MSTQTGNDQEKDAYLDTLKAQGIEMGIARARGSFLRMLVRSGLAREMDNHLLYGSVRAGIRAYRLWRNKIRRDAADAGRPAVVPDLP